MSLMPVSSRSPARSSGSEGGGEKLSSRKYTISLSFSGLITSGIISIIAIGWIFAFGVIVGRGYNPEKKLPELASLLPAPEGGEEVPKEAKGILKPEELTFMTDLKQAQPAAGVLGKADAKPAQPAAQPANPAPAPQPAEPAEPRYDFVFQAAAYKSKESANRLRAGMESAGLRSRMTVEKDGKGRPKWYRVQMVVRGTDAEATAARQALAKLGVTDATQASKKPIKGR